MVFTLGAVTKHKNLAQELCFRQILWARALEKSRCRRLSSVNGFWIFVKVRTFIKVRERIINFLNIKRLN